jgi:hypothetical protein
LHIVETNGGRSCHKTAQIDDDDDDDGGGAYYRQCTTYYLNNEQLTLLTSADNINSNPKLISCRLIKLKGQAMFIAE